MPKPMATINTVFSFPIKGMVVILSTGRSHRAGMTSSNPKILPNIRPKNVEKTPAQLMIPARSICFSLYRSNPPIKSRSPCPASPNMAPKIKE